MAYLMRCLAALLAAALGALCPSAARAQLIDMIQVNHNRGNFKDLTQGIGNIDRNGDIDLIFSLQDSFDDGYASPRAFVPRLWNYDSLKLSTGEIIEHTNSFWIFNCESAGFITSAFSDCLVHPYLSKSNSREATVDFFSNHYDLHGTGIVEWYLFDAPLIFSVNPEVARLLGLSGLLGLSEGGNVGSVRIAGVGHPHFVERKYLWPVPYSASSTNIGNLSVPEPSTVVLLAILVGALALSYQMRWWLKRN